MMINHCTIDYQVTNFKNKFNTFSIDGSDGQIKIL